MGPQAMSLSCADLVWLRQSSEAQAPGTIRSVHQLVQAGNGWPAEIGNLASRRVNTTVGWVTLLKGTRFARVNFHTAGTTVGIICVR